MRKATTFDPDVAVQRYLEHIKTLPVYGSFIADLMECHMKLTHHIGQLYQRIADLERYRKPSFPEPAYLN